MLSVDVTAKAKQLSLPHEEGPTLVGPFLARVLPARMSELINIMRDPGAAAAGSPCGQSCSMQMNEEEE